MKKILILLILITACSTNSVKKPPVKLDKLNEFFIRCENDIRNASKVIIEKDIVKNLTHLQNMNFGGKKYYLLERESTTKMIQTVTKGIYSDYILINKAGKIIYTKSNDDIFGKNVRTSLRNSPLNKSYDNRDKEIFFCETTSYPLIKNAFFLLVSIKVKGGNSFPGIFILQIDISKIEELLNSNTQIINYYGKYIVSHDHSKIYSQYKYINNIETQPFTDIKHFTINKKINISYNYFEFWNLRWFILTKR